MTHRFTIPFNPVPASRPRVGRNSTYYKDPYKSFLEQAPELVRAAWTGEPLDTWITAIIWVYPKRPKKPANPFPAADYDNYAKAVGDAMEGVVFVNDKQIVDGRCVKQYAPAGAEGYIEVIITELSEQQIKTGTIGGGA